MSGLSVRGLTKAFGDLIAVEDVSLDVRDGEFLCLLGPSGCGKSTTLRMIGGLETPTEGTIELGDGDVTDVPAYKRDTSTVFQDWALFPYKTVLENVTFGLRMDGVGAEKRKEQAREMLETMQIAEYEDQMPEDLSGGQQQRVALARSLVTDPSVLLLDEPLSNLDKRLREQMQIELTDLQERFDTTFIHVTHDQDEAFTIADRIGIMNDGRLVQVGDPRNVYENPKNEFVESFLGDTNFVSGEVATTDGPHPTVDTDLGARVPMPNIDSEVAAGLEVGDPIQLSLRPEELSISAADTRKEPEPIEATADGGSSIAVDGSVESVLYRGSVVRYMIDVDGEPIFIERSVSHDDELDVSDDVTVCWNTVTMLAFDGEGTRIGGGAS